MSRAGKIGPSGKGRVQKAVQKGGGSGQTQPKTRGPRNTIDGKQTRKGGSNSGNTIDGV